MRTLQKWNSKLGKYEPHIIPDSWEVTKYSALGLRCNCASCGVWIKYGQTYTSLEIHDQIGFGFAVCPKCHHKEMERAGRGRGPAE